MAFTLAQISDTHLGAGTTLFRGNFRRVAAMMHTLHPDLLVASGDLTLDGAGSAGEADLAFAAKAFGELPGPVLAVPGNHDVGDHPALTTTQPVDDARLDRFRSHLGQDRWVVDRDGWRLMGLNSQIMGAHAGEEAAQAGMITEALASLGGRRLAVFLHKPVFVGSIEGDPFDYWSVPPVARGGLAAVLAHPALRLVASGHLHVQHGMRFGAVSYQWAPSVAFVVSPLEQPGLPGTRPCGVLLHRFGEDAVETELLAPAGMETPDVRDTGVYPAS